MEQKFIRALVKVLDERIFKNERLLCMTAGVDQGGFNKFLKTARYKLGTGDKPETPKGNLNLTVVSKLVDAMGGELVFPWDKDAAENYSEVIKLKEELASMRKKIDFLEKELYACEKTKLGYENIIRDKLPSYEQFPVEVRQNKSCA